jgi:nitroreductase
VDTIETIMARRSIRGYKAEPIPDAHLRLILEAGRQAPSASNRQPWHFIVVGDLGQRQSVARACGGQMWMADAAYIIVALGLPAISGKWYRVDVSIALQNIVLAACSLGYGTCWIGDFSAPDLKDICRIPQEMDVVACTPLGVPNVAPAARPRKQWAQVFSKDKYGEVVSTLTP